MSDAHVGLQGDLIIVEEDERVNHFLWGLMMALTLGGFWAMQTFVEMTRENRIASYVLVGLMSTTFTALWVYGVLHPARLEISYGTIVERRRGVLRSITLQRTTGEVAFGVRSAVIAGRGAVTPILHIPGERGTEIAITSYDRNKLKQACETVGWRFVTPDPGS